MPSRSSTPRSQGQPSSLTSSLVSAIGELTTEVGRLREVVALGSRSFSRQSLHRVDSSADFVSAQGDSDNDEDFFE